MPLAHQTAAVCTAKAFLLGLCVVLPAWADNAEDTIARVKPSIVAVGTYERGRSPAFKFHGTGFAVGDGTTIATNAHVLSGSLDALRRETLAVLVPGSGASGEVREALHIATASDADLALLKITGSPLPPLKLARSGSAREGRAVFLTGFPIGHVLGPFPATHRGMISAITPIAMPQARAAELKPTVIRRLAAGTFPIYQLDATAYPGSSGSPVYDPATGEVIGIVNMVLVKSTKESVLSQPSGITYAVPAGHLEELLQDTAHRAPK